MRSFEFPYNFDKNLLFGLKIFDPEGLTINCIYMPPYLKDYKTILRNGEQAFLLDNMTREEYEDHISFINTLFPGKIQILLQKKEILMSESILKYYLNQGISKFCVASIEQAKIIKNINKNIEVVGSIAMQITPEIINDNYTEFLKYFNGFVLPFSGARSLDLLKNFSKSFYYILLVNAYCNIKCNGKNHWNYNYSEDYDVKCPGILTKQNKDTFWPLSARIRPMDLGFFDPYIYVYKLQDRGWTTEEILRDYVLYTSDYQIYPDIIYNERIYYHE